MQEPISADRLSVLIGLIYDAAIDPSRWPVATEAIRLELGFQNSALNLQRMPSGAILTNVTTNIPPEYGAMIDGAGLDVVEQWGGVERLSALPFERAAVLSRVNPEFDAETSTNGYFLRFAKPQGIVDVLAIGLARDSRALGSLAFGRHHAAGPIGEREVAVAEMLIPHLQRAATINRMLDHAELARHTLDLLAAPVLLIDRRMRILHRNAAATALLDRRDLIRDIGGVLEVVAPGAQAALADALEQAVRDEIGIASNALGIPVRRAVGSGGALHVLPVRGDRVAPDVGAIAAIFVTQADASFVAPTGIVAALFDLTSAEARVFEFVVAGHTMVEAARALGVEPSTVKTHLLRLYDKMGVRRRSALVQIATSLAIPLAAEAKSAR